MKCLQVLLYITNNTIERFLFVCIQLNGYKYYYVSLKVKLNFSQCLNNSSCNNSFEYMTFVCTELNVKQFYLTHR